MIGLSDHSWKISWDANEVKSNWVIAFWANLFRLRDIKSLFLDRKSDMIDELKIEDLKHQFKADANQYPYLPYLKYKNILNTASEISKRWFKVICNVFLPVLNPFI